MAKDNAAPDAEVSGNVMFYRQPEPLSLEHHRLLGVKRVDNPFAFLRAGHVAPLTAHEFAAAGSSYPIIFAGSAKAPLAVMGARPGENVFVDSKGALDPEMYLPFFVRRYPFVFASDDDNQRFVLCIDRAAPMVSEGPDVPFFNGSETSQFTNEAVELCRQFEMYRNATTQFVQRVTELDLWETKDVAITPAKPDGSPGDPIMVADFFAVSENKLNALPADKFMQLRDEGLLVPIYAHLCSQLLWPKILNRALAGAGQSDVPLR